ncbi:MAG: c-type cytochrome biogenesis protein CcmI [Pseudomonadota bacterium]
MTFWIIAIGAALVMGGFIAWPLLRRAESAAPRAAHDAQVFRDQLKELERDVARGTVSPEDAETTKLELSRRLLAADEEMRAAGGAGPAPAQLSRGLAAAVIVAAPLAAGLIYSDIGAPGAEDAPLASRGDSERPSQAEAEQMMAGRDIAPPAGPDAAEFETLVKQLETRLEERPDDREGLFLYARSLMNLGRFGDAWPQFKRLTELGDKRAEIYAGLAEGMILAAGGYISPEAEANLLQVLKYEPTSPSGRYYLGRLHMQNDDQELAASIWGRLLEESPADAPWVPPIQQELAALGAPTAPLPGPTREEMQAAGNIPPAERQAMVQSMVASLATRLAEQGGSVEEWARLIRSYSVLGDQQSAQQALRAAREAFANDPLALSRLESDGSAPAPGPSQEDMAAAQEMSPNERQAMIEGMVERLALRLSESGGSVEEWLRLISSYSVLGDQAKAAEAYASARTAYADDPRALAVLESAVEGGPRQAQTESPSPGPTREDIQAASEMSADDRQQMIVGMVSRLHERLREEGRVADVNEWGKLMRSYGVLGDKSSIDAAYEEAIEIYKDDSISLAYLKEASLIASASLE